MKHGGISHIERMMLRHILADPEKFHVTERELRAAQNIAAATDTTSKIDPDDLEIYKALIKASTWPLSRDEE